MERISERDSQLTSFPLLWVDISLQVGSASLDLIYVEIDIEWITQYRHKVEPEKDPLPEIVAVLFLL